MKVFLDTNILIDLAENRKESAQAAVILQLGEDGIITLAASFLTFANMGYIWRDVPRHERYERIRNASIGIEILPMSADQLYKGLAQEVRDYEGSQGVCPPVRSVFGVIKSDLRSLECKKLQPHSREKLHRGCS